MFCRAFRDEGKPGTLEAFIISIPDIRHPPVLPPLVNLDIPFRDSDPALAYSECPKFLTDSPDLARGDTERLSSFFNCERFHERASDFGGGKTALTGLPSAAAMRHIVSYRGTCSPTMYLLSRASDTWVLTAKSRCVHPRSANSSLIRFSILLRPVYCTYRLRKYNLLTLSSDFFKKSAIKIESVWLAWI